jgi:DNA modification methylase
VSEILTVSINAEHYLAQIATLPAGLDGVVISTPVDPSEIGQPFSASSEEQPLLDYLKAAIVQVAPKIKEGGYLFIYGLPRYLPALALDLNESDDWLFKYWIALDLAHKVIPDQLASSHLGLLMYLKGKRSPLNLNTDRVRLPYTACAACGKNLKDWGGKKHQLNKAGSALSDVWKDFYQVSGHSLDPEIPGLTLNHLDLNRPLITDFTVTPAPVLARITALVENGSPLAHLICAPLATRTAQIQVRQASVMLEPADLPNDIYLGDSVEVLADWAQRYPDGCFDLIFADPPYNLAKDYATYSDAEIDQDYLNWCDAWLAACIKLLRPGGALVVLNLPKWSIYHTRLLNQELFFQNWIIWDALSTPKGKIMPAHYSLLYYTKGPVGKFNQNPALTRIPRSDYCARPACLRSRQASGQTETVALSDLWSDLSRIKHRRDRDEHPCQLPEKLMRRIIELFSAPGDFVLDPFSGVGTTALVAKELGRRYAAVDIDEKYVKIGRAKLAEFAQSGSITKPSIKKVNTGLTKKTVELYMAKLCLELGHLPSEPELRTLLAADAQSFDLDTAITLFGDFRLVIKAGRVALKRQALN